MKKRTLVLVAFVLLAVPVVGAFALAGGNARQEQSVENVFDRPLNCDQLPDTTVFPEGQSEIIDDWRAECGLEQQIAQK